MASNPNQYRIANDEYVTDFSYLNPTQAGCLFKLRTAYFFSRSPLSAEQVAYLCPAVTEQDQQAREFVLSKFFTFSEGFWHSELMEEKIYLAKQEQEILEAEEKAREIRSLKARQSINARWNKKLVGNANNPIPKIAANTSKNTIEDTIVHTNVDTNPIRPNIRSYKENDTNVYTNVSADSNQSSETTEPQEVSGDSKNSEKTVQSASHAYAHARTDPISDIRSVCINNLINNKQHRSVSVSVSGSDRENNVKDLFNKGNTPWSIDEVLQTLIFFGLDEKSLDRWRKRSQENESAVAELAQTGMAAFDFDTVSQVFARCQQAKDKEGKPLSSAIAFVIKSLQRELTAIRNRRLVPERAQQKKSKSPRPFNAEECLKELIENPDGTYTAAPKRSSYADRDYTAGLIEQPDGTYRAAPRPRN